MTTLVKRLVIWLLRDTARQKDELQFWHTNFNELYAKAVATNGADDSYFEAALAGRQLADKLAQYGFVEDDLGRLLKQWREAQAK